MARGNGFTVDIVVVPVFDEQVVAFDVASREARGRWLPWDRLIEGTSPWETAATLCDEWCGGPPGALELVDAIGTTDSPAGLVLVFRAALTEMPAGDDVRAPVAIAAGDPTLRPLFTATDLERWARAEKAEPTAPAPIAPPAGAAGLIF